MQAPVVIHSLPVNLDADGISIEIPDDFKKVSEAKESDNSGYKANLRGRCLEGKTFQLPPEAELCVLRCENSHALEEQAGVLRTESGPVEKLVIWNTDAPSDMSEKLQSGLLFAKLSGALSKKN